MILRCGRTWPSLAPLIVFVVACGARTGELDAFGGDDAGAPSTGAGADASVGAPLEVALASSVTVCPGRCVDLTATGMVLDEAGDPAIAGWRVAAAAVADATIGGDAPAVSGVFVTKLGW